MADLLALCRDFTIHKKEIKEEGDEIIFENYAWSKNAKTNFVVWGSEKNGSVKEYYPLESIVYFLKNASLTHAQFVRQSAASNILGIRLPDRQKLLDYLHGKTTTCDSIDHSVLIDISLRRIITAETNEPVEDFSREPATKKLRMDEVGQLNGALDQSTNSSLQAKLDLKPGSKIASDLANAAATANKTSNLTAVIPQDKLQMLRAKFRANHQQMIKPDDEERAAALMGSGILQQSDISLLGSGDSIISKKEDDSENTTQKSYTRQLGATKAFVKEIMSREYTWRTRISVLQSMKKTFFDSIVQGTLKTVKLKEENLHGHQNNLGPHTPFIPSGVKMSNDNMNGSKIGMGVASNVSGIATGGNNAPTHYSRYDQERFTQAGQDTAGFKIDTMGTYHGKGLSSVMTDGSQANRDPRKQPGKAVPQDNSKPGAGGKQKPKSRMPIIIIPSNLTSLITMYNAKDILQDLRFEKTEDKKASKCGRDTELLIQRQKSDGRTVPYRVIDQPARLAREDWDRVVAVFVQGPAWQFKGWPIGRGDPVEIFAAVKAFHLKYSHMPLHPDVKKWNVEVISLDQRRHLDKANFQKIWDALDRHMIKMKPHLRF